jgi:quinohemoprotein ethanol dehydrogenase
MSKTVSRQLSLPPILTLLIALAVATAHADTATEWPNTGNDPGGGYFSSLKTINDKNVERLGFAWEYRTGTKRGMEATPLVKDGVMYTSGIWGVVYALNASTGALLWKYDPQNDGLKARNSCCDVVNRGVVLAAGRVFVASTDGKLSAISAKDGRKIWEASTFIDNEARASTGAPLLAGDLVIIGNAGSDMGERGARAYVSAYDQSSGSLRWRFWVVPSKDASKNTPELNSALKTWDPRAIPSGGAVWDGMAYDKDLGLVYLGTGNAAPYQTEGRNPGGHGIADNLYTDSVVALHAKTGELAWYFQTSPGDSLDQDAVSPFILTDLKINGKERRVIMQAPKNGFFYVWDSATGELLSGKPFTYINWARGLDAKGRPILTKEADYTETPQIIYPGTNGGHSWPPMSYSPQTGLVYIPVLDAPMLWIDLKHRPLKFVDSTFGVGVIFLDPTFNPADWDAWYGKLPQYKDPGQGGPRRIIRGVLRAWDPVAQRSVWEQETSKDYFVYDGGVLSTAGNLVFQGRSDGSFVAYAADSGKTLISLPTGVSIMAAPMTYEINGTQYIAVLEGYGGGSIGATYAPKSAPSEYENTNRIVVFKLDGGAVPLPDKLQPAPTYPVPDLGTVSAADLKRGSDLYFTYCGRCHVFGNGPLPDLRNIPPGIHASFDSIVLKGAFRTLGMAKFDDVLSPDGVKHIHEYLVDEAKKLQAVPAATGN